MPRTAVINRSTLHLTSLFTLSYCSFLYTDVFYAWWIHIRHMKWQMNIEVWAAFTPLLQFVGASFNWSINRKVSIFHHFVWAKSIHPDTVRSDRKMIAANPLSYWLIRNMPKIKTAFELWVCNIFGFQILAEKTIWQQAIHNLSLYFNFWYTRSTTNDFVYNIKQPCWIWISRNISVYINIDSHIKTCIKNIPLHVFGNW